VPCAVDLLWGERDLDRWKAASSEVVPRTADVVPRSVAESGKGAVRLRLVIGVDGRVRRAEVIEGDAGLTGAAVESVKQGEYRPTLLNGVPVEVITETDVDVGLLR
jgi:periplasmic protein TonB